MELAYLKSKHSAIHTTNAQFKDCKRTYFAKVAKIVLKKIPTLQEVFELEPMSLTVMKRRGNTYF